MQNANVVYNSYILWVSHSPSDGKQPVKPVEPVDHTGNCQRNEKGALNLHHVSSVYIESLARPDSGSYRTLVS